MNATFGPPVKCGYCGWLIQGCENIIQHKCLEHYSEFHHYLKVDDNFVVTLIPRPEATQDTASKEVGNEYVESDELLIKAVAARPGPYNQKIPVKERTKLKKNALWLEVSNSLGETTDNLKKRWQYLRDCFMKEKNKQSTYRPSGYAAIPAKKAAFRYYEQMKFLCDSLPSIQTTSNIEPPQSPNGSSCSGFSPIHSTNSSPVRAELSSFSPMLKPIYPVEHRSPPSPSPPSRTPTPGAKKRKTDDSNSDLQAALVTALQEPLPRTVAVDGMMARIGEGLRRLPYRERCTLEIKFLTLLMEAEEKYNLPE